MKKKKIFIYFKNHDVDIWKNSKKKIEFTDWGYDGKMFTILKDGVTVGYYNIDQLTAIIVK